MFKIKSVVLNNFRSFIGTHKWVLNEKPGLYFLTGQNYDNPRLGRNGLGKSSLLDAISWCDHGKTTRSLRGPDVISRGCNTCSVSVTHIVGEEEFTVTRTQSPNSLKINGKVSDQEELTKKLRLNFEAFLYSIIIPQAGNSFLDLSPGEKLTLFSQIMDLDFWLEKSQLAADRAKQLENDKAIIENSIARLNGSIIALNSTIEDLKIKSKEFDKKKEEIISELLEKCTQVSNRICKLRTTLSELVSTKVDTTPIEKKIKASKTQIKDLESEWIEVQKEQAVIDHELTSLKEAEKQFETIGPICPTCKRDVGPSHIENEIEKLKLRFKKLVKGRNNLQIVKKEIEANKNEIALGLVKQEEILANLKEEESKIKSKKIILTTEINHLERENIKFGLEIDKVEEQANEFALMVDSKKNELSSINKTIETKKSEIAKLNEDYAAVHFWVAGFKRLRLSIIEETLTALEIEVNNNLVALGLGDWKIEFDVERENKSGGITKGFITLITDPKGYTARYETLSFGETQRVKLAGSFGLANLIVERVGLVSALEVYDEITQHMSAEGIEDTLNTLRDRAVNSNKEIILIDHQSIEYGDFSGIISIIKDENGSRFDECKSG